jgi:transposase
MRMAMLSKIDAEKKLGLNKSQVARRLGINVKTVTKYWEMGVDEFQKYRENPSRCSKLEPYREVILSWLKEYPDLHGSQVFDWVKERYDDDSHSERNVRRLVADLRKKHGIDKKPLSRDYQAVQELPAGLQAQVDFGVYKAKKASGGSVKLYVMVVIFSHARFKCGVWSDKPLTSAMFVEMLRACLSRTGMPKELVFDQDRLLAVDENFGDIVYTAEFERFRRSLGLSVRLCRKGDPETKGKVEAAVKFVKGNFARHRVYANLEVWTQEFEAWLTRTGNSKIHGTTKKVPAESFLAEKQFLTPVPHTNTSTESLTRNVRKDNTVIYKSNRYSVPLGTYRPGREVEVEENDGMLSLSLGEQVIATHKVSSSKGQLIQSNNHIRDHSASIDVLLKRVVELLDNSPEVAAFLTEVRKAKPRYIRDQLTLLERVIRDHSKDTVMKAIAYCAEKELFSTTHCRDAAETIFMEEAPPVAETAKLPEKYRIASVIRNIAVYASLLGGVAGE